VPGGRNRPVRVLAAKASAREDADITTRTILIAAFPRVQTLDVFGPAEVFATASKLRGDDAYDLRVVASEPGLVRTSSVPLHAEALDDGPIDTLLVPGGRGVLDACEDERFVAWVQAAAGRARRVTSVCTGAFLLARAGLLDGRRATTHWASCAELARLHPEVTVEPDPIYVRDGNVTTSAGVTAGMDLALALVEEDLGRELALEAARWLVVFLKRPGGQAQFSAQLAAQMAEREPLRELQAWLPDHLTEDLSVPALARRAGMSERHFARAFRDETGMTPAAYVEAARVERARIALESGALPVETIAAQTGFGTVETLRRAFRRRVGVSPADYRTRFRRGAA
jgi:transcriptional regulator GlxA family with amidase domain